MGIKVLCLNPTAECHTKDRRAFIPEKGIEKGEKMRLRIILMDLTIIDKLVDALSADSPPSTIYYDEIF